MFRLPASKPVVSVAGDRNDRSTLRPCFSNKPAPCVTHGTVEAALSVEKAAVTFVPVPGLAAAAPEAAGLALALAPAEPAGLALAAAPDAAGLAVEEDAGFALAPAAALAGLAAAEPAGLELAPAAAELELAGAAAAPHAARSRLAVSSSPLATGRLAACRRDRKSVV